MAKSELYDFAGQKRNETEKAFLIFDGDQEVWLPKSHVEENGDGTFTIPQWLAEEKKIV